MRSDCRGRLRYSAEQKATLVEAYQTSVLGGPGFAAIQGVNYQILAGWLQKRKKSEKFAGASGLPNPVFLSFVPAALHTVPYSARRGKSSCPAGQARHQHSRPESAGCGPHPGTRKPTGMLSFSGSLKVFVAAEPCDMRRSLLKILYWEGIWILAKRLERGTFSWSVGSIFARASSPWQTVATVVGLVWRMSLIWKLTSLCARILLHSRWKTPSRRSPPDRDWPAR